MIPGVVLAGGRSSRMGRPKALLPTRDGEPFLTRVVRTLREGGVDDQLVVLGFDAETIAGAIDTGSGVRFVVNPAPANGQLSSLLTALTAIDRPGVEAMLVTLVDVPLVSSATVARLLEVYRQTRAPIVRPASADRHGHPVVFDRALFDELRQASLDTGLRPVIRRHARDIQNVGVDDPGAFLDIDTPEDYLAHIGPLPPSSYGS